VSEQEQQTKGNELTLSTMTMADLRIVMLLVNKVTIQVRRSKSNKVTIKFNVVNNKAILKKEEMKRYEQKR
jgi:hypothetical protein